jgi:hypothetical protein
MTNIEKRDYGFKITFSGSIDLDEMTSWVDASKNALVSQTSAFGVMVDMRELSPLAPSVGERLQDGQKLYKEKGMTRSAVAVNQGFVAAQLKMVAQDTGIYEWERYVDASINTNWENTCIDWIANGKDPDVS